MAHMAFSFIVLLPVMATKGFRELHRPSLERQWLGLMSVGAFFAVNIGFNNVSLLSISLSLNQVIRYVQPRGGSVQFWLCPCSPLFCCACCVVDDHP